MQPRSCYAICQQLTLAIFTLLLFQFSIGSACATETANPSDAFACSTLPNDPSAQLCYLLPDNDVSQWFLFRKNDLYQIDAITPDAEMGHFEFSPSGKFLVVASSSEGHPMLQLYATHQLVQNLQVDLLQGWSGYPDWVSSNGWQGDALIIESNVPLHQAYDRSADYPESESSYFRWDIEHPDLVFIGKKPVDPDPLRTGANTVLRTLKLAPF